jgi:transcription antitermination protein NusB
MTTRREGREWALQLLFQLEANPREADDALRDFWRETQADTGSRAFVEGHVKGVREHLAGIDDLIRRYAEHWDIRRMGAVDRNVMRMAIYEMMHCPDIPPEVAINEAVDLAKYFSSRESGSFVNGILDRILKEEVKRETRPAQETVPAPGERRRKKAAQEPGGEQAS